MMIWCCWMQLDQWKRGVLSEQLWQVSSAQNVRYNTSPVLLRKWRGSSALSGLEPYCFFSGSDWVASLYLLCCIAGTGSRYWRCCTVRSGRSSWGCLPWSRTSVSFSGTFYVVWRVGWNWLCPCLSCTKSCIYSSTCLTSKRLAFELRSVSSQSP